MRVVLVLAALGLLLMPSSSAAPAACVTGGAQGFAALRFSPLETVGTIPNRWTGSNRYFWRKHNCTGRGVFVRRRDVGVFEINFPGLGYRLGIVSAISQEGASASVWPFGTGVFRVVVRGPIVENGLLTRRDVPSP